MGSKTPVRKLRKNVFKCDICHRGLLSQAALESHQMCVHSSTLKARARARISKPATPGRIALKPKTPNYNTKASITVETPSKQTPKAIPSKQTPKGIPLKETPKVTRSGAIRNQPVKEEPQDVIDNGEKVIDRLKNTKVCFECPVEDCKKVFPVYFRAQRHIQKTHCINSQGKAVLPKSADQLKPRHIEICITCEKPADSDHRNCGDNAIDADPSEKDIISATVYNCLKCKEQYRSMSAFDLHIKAKHCDGVETLFFPDENIFNGWKKHVEGETSRQYNLLTDHNLKQMYRCNSITKHFENNSEDIPELIANCCPSMMIVQKYSKGIQVHYYRTHSDHNNTHNHCEYKVSGEYEKYTLENFTKQLGNPDRVPDLFGNLTTLLYNILTKAKEASEDKLNLLLEKAEEMDAVLSEDKNKSNESPTVNKKNLTDNQISNALNKTPKQKRKQSVNELEDFVSPVKLRKKGQESKKVKLNDLGHTTNNGESPKSPVVPFILERSPSFNDSYKQFVEKKLIVEPTPVLDVGRKPKILKKNVLKTKIGQFKPSILPKKKIELLSLDQIKVETYEVVEQEDDCNILVLKI